MHILTSHWTLLATICNDSFCTFQSNVQLGLDFVSPESLGEALRLAEEIRCLPNDHESKLQILEVSITEILPRVMMLHVLLSLISYM